MMAHTKDERNHLRTDKFLHAEFEIADQEYRDKNESWWRKPKLDFPSFVYGFEAGMRFMKRGCDPYEDDEEEPDG